MGYEAKDFLGQHAEKFKKAVATFVAEPDAFPASVRVRTPCPLGRCAVDVGIERSTRMDTLLDMLSAVVAPLGVKVTPGQHVLLRILEVGVAKHVFYVLSSNPMKQPFACDFY